MDEPLAQACLALAPCSTHEQRRRMHHSRMVNHPFPLRINVCEDRGSGWGSLPCCSKILVSSLRRDDVIVRLTNLP